MKSLLVRHRPLLSVVGGAVLGQRFSTKSSCDFVTKAPTAKLGLCQIQVGADKEANIAHAKKSLKKAKSMGAELIVLPECWNSPYATTSFPVYAEVLPDVGGQVDSKKTPSVAMLSEVAKSEGVWLVGGSVPERVLDDSGSEKIYNTSVIINPKGEIVGKHRKVHLFDINIPGKVTFRESDTLSPGNSVTTVESPWGPLGVGICYDLRFPELATVMRQRGCGVLIYPGAFNMTTGPLHWTLLQRARAVDNNVFVATCSPARVKGSNGYVAYGHSSVISPMGEVVADAGTGDNVVVYELELEQVQNMRDRIPCWSQKRHDLYETLSK